MWCNTISKHPAALIASIKKERPNACCGAVMREANRQALHRGGRVIYLHASVEQQVGRTARDRNRPLLRTANPRETLRTLYEARQPFYRQADVVVESAAERSVEEMAARVVEAGKREVVVTCEALLRPREEVPDFTLCAALAQFGFVVLLLVLRWRKRFVLAAA